jgi:exopolyphosphatase/guanosine-5'-triphosphate,3'-diphosphate pyrophosphatase
VREAAPAPERRLAVADLGSNSFRLVVYRYRPGGPWLLTDEVRESVRLASGVIGDALAADAIARAGRAARLFSAFCRATAVDEVDAVATSAIRSAPNRAEALAAIGAYGGLRARVLSERDETVYAYLGVVNSMSVADALFLDVGGGSVQIGRIAGRRLEESLSEPLGAVRVTERFLGGKRTGKRQVKALREHVAGRLAGHEWLGDAERVVGVGGTARTLAAIAQRRLGYPIEKLHGFVLERELLAEIVDELARTPVLDRRRIPGLKADRADIVLGGAIVIECVLDAVGAAALDVCGHGLREGVFFERYLGAGDPLVPDVRRASVQNLAGLYRVEQPHAERVGRLALELLDGAAALGLHEATEGDRELLWAAAILHDVGVVVDYHDHHKHSAYLVLNGGLPGFSHRELAVVALLVRGHRKSLPDPAELAPLLAAEDRGRLLRLGACLRIAEQLDRGHTGVVDGISLVARDGTISATLRAGADPGLQLFAASQECGVFEQAFGRPLVLETRTSVR